MAKVEHTSDARVLVGIDISKHRHEVLIAIPGKTRRRRRTRLSVAGDTPVCRAMCCPHRCWRRSAMIRSEWTT